MTDIDVPSWVVDAAQQAYYEHDDNGSCQYAMTKALRAALAAWVVPTATISRRSFERFTSTEHGSQAMFHLYAAYDDDVTLYTLRQEKPE